jgi:hypothetical protein
MASASKVCQQIEAFAAQHGYALHRIGAESGARRPFWSLDPADAGAYDLEDPRSFPLTMGTLKEVWAWVQQQQEGAR